MRVLLLILLRLIFRIETDTISRKSYDYKLEGSSETLVQEIRHATRNWEQWFSQREIAWVKGFRSGPPPLAVQRSAATPSPLDRAPEVQPEEKVEEEAEDPELLGWRHRIGPVMFALLLLGAYVVIINKLVPRELSPYQHVIEAVPISQ